LQDRLLLALDRLLFTPVLPLRNHLVYVM
jgi:hypothetical protein